MANEIRYQDVVATLEENVGYQGERYDSKFTRFLDSVNWYCAKKAGATTWCCILVDYAIAVNKGDLSYEQARVITCEPANHSVNYGAGVKEKAQYFKNAGRWISSSKNATTGDQIFLNGLNHVGTIVGWDGAYFIYIDGSTTYNGKPYSVGKKRISFGASNIDGFGRPDWYKYQTPDPAPTPTPTTKIITVELPVLKLGSKGGEVLTIQMLLNEIGFTGKDGKRLTLDGNYGENVKYAVTNYQKARGLTADGICGYDTWNRILK